MTLSLPIMSRVLCDLAEHGFNMQVGTGNRRSLSIKIQESSMASFIKARLSHRGDNLCI